MNQESQPQGWIAWAGYAWLVFVGACVVAASWTGLVGFATDTLELDGRARYIVPVTLDGLTVTFAFLALRAVVAGDSAALPRILAWIMAAAGAAANYYHATVSGQGEAAALYFGGMTLLVYLGFEVILRQLRRIDLRQQGAVERPLPRFRPIRWIRFPRLTFRAWSAAVRHGLTDPAEALARVDVQRTLDEIAGPPGIQVVGPVEPQPALEIRENTTERSITVRNGTQTARIRELYDAGARTIDEVLAKEPAFQRDSVRKALARIEQQRSGS